jgi:uncharacterized membrane protein (GlpM family)
MLALKLSLVPLFLLTVSLAARRWGPQVGGALAGFPVITGPILLIIALEQGNAFAAQAAVGSLAAVAALLAFAVCYSWVCRRWPWPLTLTCAVSVWFVTATLLARSGASASMGAALVAALAALLLAPFVLPKRSAQAPLVGLPAAELLARMVAGALLTLLITTVAARLGASWSGLLAVFPVIATVLGVFSQRTYGPAFVARIFRGTAFGLYSFAVFCLLLGRLLPQSTILAAFGVAAGAAVIVQLLVQRLLAILERGPRQAAPDGS